MAQGLPRTIAAALLAAGMVHCSLVAPSDQELMGGNKGSGSGSSSGSGSGSGSDAGDAGRSDAMDGSQGGDGSCSQATDCCNLTSDCCSGLVCNPAAGICEPCTPNGGGCFGSQNNCCSGNCTGHTCR